MKRESEKSNMTGYLVKGKTVFTRKKLFFVLNHGHLDYYKNESRENMIGSMDLNDAKISVPMKKGFCFELDVNTSIVSPPSSPSLDDIAERKRKTYMLTAQTQDIRNRWMNSIQTNITLLTKSDDTVSSDESNKNEIRALKDATRRVSQYSLSESSGSMNNFFHNEEQEEEQESSSDGEPPVLPSRGEDYHRRLSIVSDMRRASMQSVLSTTSSQNLVDDDDHAVVSQNEMVEEVEEEKEDITVKEIEKDVEFHDEEAPPTFSMPEDPDAPPSFSVSDNHVVRESSFGSIPSPPSSPPRTQKKQEVNEVLDALFDEDPPVPPKSDEESEVSLERRSSSSDVPPIS